MAINIGRRELSAALGCSAVWPLPARAQQTAMLVVGFHPVAFVSFVPAERAVRGARARLSRTSIAEEMREAHRRQILGE